MLAPLMVLSGPKKICTYLPKREELSLRTVLLLPKASRRGLQARILFSMEWLYFWLKLVIIFMQYLVDSVFPAPDSPDITIACFPYPHSSPW